MDESQLPQVTRNQFLKLLAAGGTAAAVAGFLPGKWAKPLIKVGVLPVHAQSSYTVHLTGLGFSDIRGFKPGKSGLASLAEIEKHSPGFRHQSIHFDYVDDFSQVDDSAVIHYTVTPPVVSGMSGSGAISDLDNGELLNNGSDAISHAGTVFFMLNLPYNYWSQNSSPTIDLTMEVNGRMSDPLSGTLPEIVD
jgi:hypothetical protein